MELRQLRYFAAVADCLSFSEAAKAACVTQSTLSQQIKQLEGELGTQLFVRTSHSVTLTETGAELLPLARRTLRDAEACSTRIADINGLRGGTLNIGVTYSFSPILTETLVTFSARYPAIKLNVLYRPMVELMELLRRREVDFALAFSPLQPLEGVESHVLFQNSLSAIVRSGHTLAGRQKVSIAELGQYDMALPARGLQARSAFDAMLRPADSLHVRMELNEVNMLLKLVSQTDFVTVLAEATIYNFSGVKAVALDGAVGDMAGCVHLLRDTYRKSSMLEFIRMLGESLAVAERRDAWLRKTDGYD